jgi:hypothetical protein
VTLIATRPEGGWMNPRIIARTILVTAATISLFSGCEPPSPAQSAKGVITSDRPPKPPVPPPPPPPPPGEEGTTPATSLAVANSQTNPVARNPVAPQPALPTAAETTPSATAAKPFIKLSVGIALPQTLPDGTQVGVSCDYKLLKPSLNSAAKYLWVIESAKGEIAMEVQIKPQGGNLAGFLPLEIRPSDSPFKARIDEVATSGSRVTVSNVEPLQ